MHLESALDGLVVLGVRIELSHRVIACDDDLAWANLTQAVTLAFTGERVVVSPDLEVLSADHLGA